MLDLLQLSSRPVHRHRLIFRTGICHAVQTCQSFQLIQRQVRGSPARQGPGVCIAFFFCKGNGYACLLCLFIIGKECVGSFLFLRRLFRIQPGQRISIAIFILQHNAFVFIAVAVYECARLFHAVRSKQHGQCLIARPRIIAQTDRMRHTVYAALDAALRLRGFSGTSGRLYLRLRRQFCICPHAHVEHFSALFVCIDRNIRQQGHRISGFRRIIFSKGKVYVSSPVVSDAHIHLQHMKCSPDFRRIHSQVCAAHGNTADQGNLRRFYAGSHKALPEELSIF